MGSYVKYCQEVLMRTGMRWYMI